ncbi:MAG: chemotaxis protein CheR [Treponemataceae bacterium]|nr:chemotaxis protein CheR [Treponemataceae bacterium]
MADFISRAIQLTDKDFKTISSYIESNTGIRMPEAKRIMIQSRLIGRLKALGFEKFSDYIDYAFNEDTSGNELILLTDALTTNKTEFFRENDHFQYLERIVLPEIVKNGIKSPCFWSAGCSSGEEVYTISIVLREYMRLHRGAISNYHIFASDLSTKVLDKAVNAVYDEVSIENIPFEQKRRYFLKSSDRTHPKVRIKPELRSCVSFRRLNFMDSYYNISETFHVIFCRNVLIYFDKQTQEKIISKLIRHLIPGGYLFLGHSETILAMNLPLVTVAPTVYRKTEEASRL